MDIQLHITEKELEEFPKEGFDQIETDTGTTMTSDDQSTMHTHTHTHAHSHIPSLPSLHIKPKLQAFA